MKLVLILFTFLLAMQGTNAQVDKDNVMLGGTLGYTSLKNTAPISGAEYKTHE